MKAHKITILVIDFDELGAEEAKIVLENAHYPNHCMSPDVMDIQTVDLGEWTDEHPLNHGETRQAEYKRLFAAPRHDTVKTCATCDMWMRKSKLDADARCKILNVHVMDAFWCKLHEPRQADGQE